MAGHSQPNHDAVVSLRQRLSDSFVKAENGKRFIPDGTLEEIMDEPSLYQTLLALEGSRNLVGCDVQTICQQVRGPFLKIFAILVLLRSHGVIFSFLKLGIDDNQLPYLGDAPDEVARGNGCGLQSKWALLKDSWSERGLYLFFDMQWSVLAPRFERSVDVLDLTGHHILPFLPVEDKSGPDAQLDRTGSFGEVRKVRIHPRHHDFRDIVQTGNSTDVFAVKKLYTHDEHLFESELNTLRHFQKFQHPHLIQLLTSFRILEHGGCDSEMASSSFIFPWADGNLRDFWAANEKLVGDERVIPWISTQCCGLAAALALVHEGGHCATTPERDKGFGMHGDIKSRNILWFKTPGKDKAQPGGLLVLADFGLSVPLHKMSRSEVSVSDIAVPATYRPPETEVSKKVSRKMDIWMLGCTYLELVTWFLLGCKAVTTDFCTFRSERNRLGINSDAFFRVDGRGDRLSAQLKPQVVEWITRLHAMPQCNQYLQQFLNLIKTRMLCANPNHRITASKLEIELQGLDCRFVKSDRKFREEVFQGNMKAFTRTLKWPIRNLTHKLHF